LLSFPPNGKKKSSGIVVCFSLLLYISTLQSARFLETAS